MSVTFLCEGQLGWIKNNLRLSFFPWVCCRYCSSVFWYSILLLGSLCQFDFLSLLNDSIFLSGAPNNSSLKFGYIYCLLEFIYWSITDSEKLDEPWVNQVVSLTEEAGNISVPGKMWCFFHRLYNILYEFILTKWLHKNNIFF